MIEMLINIFEYIRYYSGIFSLLISLIIAIRVFLLDKKYSEFKIESVTPNSSHIHSDKEGYECTILDLKIRLLKDDIYDLEFNEKDAKGKSKYIELKKDNILQFKIWFSDVKRIELKYRDSLNNKYIQTIRLVPVYMGKNPKSFSATISNRKWKFGGYFSKFFY